jgi:hypothetical protein
LKSAVKTHRLAGLANIIADYQAKS